MKKGKTIFFNKKEKEENFLEIPKKWKDNVNVDVLILLRSFCHLSYVIALIYGLWQLRREAKGEEDEKKKESNSICFYF